MDWELDTLLQLLMQMYRERCYSSAEKFYSLTRDIGTSKVTKTFLKVVCNHFSLILLLSLLYFKRKAKEGSWKIKIQFNIKQDEANHSLFSRKKTDCIRNGPGKEGSTI